MPPPSHNHTHHPQPPLPPPQSKLPIDFSPPLIAMVVIAAAAFLFITYSRLISRFFTYPFTTLLKFFHRCRRNNHHYPYPDIESPSSFPSSPNPPLFFDFSPYGLDESIITRIPLSLFSHPSPSPHDCAVCLLSLEPGDYIRTLPICSHLFHVDCIDVWLRSHATCPLCRSCILTSPLSPIMAPRVSSSLDNGLILESLLLHPLIETSREIQEEGEFQFPEEREWSRDDDGFLLKRSHSFGFERSYGYPSERMMVLEALTTPYHHHRGRNRRRGMFFKRPAASTTPFGKTTARVFSFRGGGGERKYSPGFFKFRRGKNGFNFGSSVSPICGYPEALISPDRLR